MNMMTDKTKKQPNSLPAYTIEGAQHEITQQLLWLEKAKWLPEDFSSGTDPRILVADSMPRLN